MHSSAHSHSHTHWLYLRYDIVVQFDDIIAAFLFDCIERKTFPDASSSLTLFDRLSVSTQTENFVPSKFGTGLRPRSSLLFYVHLFIHHFTENRFREIHLSNICGVSRLHRLKFAMFEAENEIEIRRLTVFRRTENISHSFDSSP